MGQAKSVLIVGITGGIGSETARSMVTAGWSVRALHRDPAGAKFRVSLPAAIEAAIEWVSGDAMRRADMVSAASGCDAIVHAANPPGYRNWRGLALPMVENAVAAAAQANARLVLPGNIYNYGPETGSPLAEDAPQNPVTEKGRVRVEMEALLAGLCSAGGRGLIVRAGDYFGSHAPASWLHTVMVKPGRPVRSVTWPGDATTGHAFAYLPDLAAAIARLLGAEDKLAAFERVHFAGHWLDPGRQVAETISRLAGGVPVRAMPWGPLRLIAPFHTTLREAMAMRYLWQTPMRLDNSRLVSLIGAEPHTPLVQALRESLIGMGCLPSGEATRGLQGRV